MIAEGLEYIAPPTTRLMMRNAVDQVPSFLSARPLLCQDTRTLPRFLVYGGQRKLDEPSGYTKSW
jgi:hypothetical protein